MAADAQGKALREALRREREVQLKAECPFAPKVDTRSAAIAGRAGGRTCLEPHAANELPERLRHEEEKRQAKLQVSYFSTHPPISPICRTPLFPYLTV